MIIDIITCNQKPYSLASLSHTLLRAMEAVSVESRAKALRLKAQPKAKANPAQPKAKATPVDPPDAGAKARPIQNPKWPPSLIPR